MIEREEMQELVREYRDPCLLIIGSHSALDAWSGARDYGLRTIIYTTKERAIIYLQNAIAGKPNEQIEDLPAVVSRDVYVVSDLKDLKNKKDWQYAILVLNRYDEIVKHVDELVELEAIQIPNRAFTVYVGGDDYCTKIENDFKVPIFGSRKLLKIENRGIERDYYWFLEKAGIPYPKAIKFKITGTGISLEDRIDRPLILKAPHPEREFERAFIFAADSEDLELKVEKAIERGELTLECLKYARVEELILGPHANFNFFFSPLNELKSWGSVEEFYAKLYKLTLAEARTCLANEFLSIDERRETILDGLKRLPVDVQLKLLEKITPSFEVTLHALVSIRESLLKDVLRCANRLILTLREYEPPGIIGAWCLQTLITWGLPSEYGLPASLSPQVTVDKLSFGLYDTSKAEAPMHIPVTQDLALRHGGGTNVHMGIGGQYGNVRYAKRLSLGGRIALEVKKAVQINSLPLLVT
ncbi:MAG: hypothetical protein DRJ26_03025 [Candidatus Methanomethylicota archaeon]|uniref:5-formaminoimidazole-4-carboxamide-1-(Beta)-D-ribofuranosyl 5'-monophosphate synthetase n=1 Tax=Thermoproteota archaeon TaxID=2056631 RepID=A0A497F388_9CREN|nr:MAG: hypothetical protein DRJ26_03025 [Candidatus Verstraetearchaeota archaeon]